MREKEKQKSSLSHDADLLKCEIAVGKDFFFSKTYKMSYVSLR